MAWGWVNVQQILFWLNSSFKIRIHIVCRQSMVLNVFHLLRPTEWSNNRFGIQLIQTLNKQRDISAGILADTHTHV